MAREISTFKAVNPDRAVIPLVLDEEADVNEIYDGLGQVQQLRCYESMLESFRQLLELLGGNTLFPALERRSTQDRRVEDRRQQTDRRTEPIQRRLRVGIWKAYSELTGRGEFDPLWSVEVGRFARFLASPDSPLQSFDFVDRRTGEQVNPRFETLEPIAYRSWDSNAKEGLSGVVYIIDDIVRVLTNAYVITSKERRGGERRSGERRGGGLDRTDPDSNT